MVNWPPEPNTSSRYCICCNWSHKVIEILGNVNMSECKIHERKKRNYELENVPCLSSKKKKTVLDENLRGHYSLKNKTKELKLRWTSWSFKRTAAEVKWRILATSHQQITQVSHSRKHMDRTFHTDLTLITHRWCFNT